MVKFLVNNTFAHAVLVGKKGAENMMWIFFNCEIDVGWQLGLVEMIKTGTIPETDNGDISVTKR